MVLVSKKSKKSQKKKNTSSSQVPWGYSPHVWVVINGHLVNPSRWSSSLGRRLRIIDLVPMGDVRNSSTSPRREAFNVMTAWTCSRYETCVPEPWQACVFNLRSSGRFVVMKLKYKKKKSFTLRSKQSTKRADEQGFHHNRRLESQLSKCEYLHRVCGQWWPIGWWTPVSFNDSTVIGLFLNEWESASR